jgi:SAM-dependent methyltransferase
VRVSFRDPDGFVYRHQNRILRCVSPEAAAEVRGFLASPFAVKSMARGVLSPTGILEGEAARGLPAELLEAVPQESVILEHRPVPFVSYPYEWAPEMLYRAAELTLELGQLALENGFRLKDATPYNILFDGPRPVFIDLLSFEAGGSTDALWRPYAQFNRTFVYPLLACRYFGLQLDELLLARRDGLLPARIAQLCPGWRLLIPPFLGAVTVPWLLTRSNGNAAPEQYRIRSAKDAEEARFLVSAVFRRAHRLLRHARVARRDTEGVRYADSGHTYTPAEMAAKEQFVDSALEQSHPGAVLDIGCNTGQFSRMAARRAERVVAIDHDPSVIGPLWKTASESGLEILPLVVDIARPPGACGWANLECPSFLDRACGAFDCILMLAVVHHLVVSERVPLGHVFDLAEKLTRRDAIVEYVDPADSQFQRIARGREQLHRDLTPETFEQAARVHFEIAASQQVTATRRLYRLKKKSA